MNILLRYGVCASQKLCVNAHPGGLFNDMGFFQGISHGGADSHQAVIGQENRLLIFTQGGNHITGQCICPAKGIACYRHFMPDDLGGFLQDYGKTSPGNGKG